MLRPRGGDFFYTKAEFTLMRRELAWLRRSGVTGIVLGLLMEHGAVDADHLRILVEEALPLDVTFHRAFDSCSDPLHALEVIIAAGVKRLLTSGQKATAHEGASLIQKLIAHSSGRIVIMPGGGITPHNIREILDLTGAREIHFSASTWYEVPSPVATGRRITTAQLVERMIAAAKTAV
jgi:copper homeostasis protein